MDRLTYRYVTKVVSFNSVKWNQIQCLLNTKGIYWFLTDPYKGEQIAVMVSKYDEQQFNEIVNTMFDANFYGKELTH